MGLGDYEVEMQRSDEIHLSWISHGLRHPGCSLLFGSPSRRRSSCGMLEILLPLKVVEAKGVSRLALVILLLFGIGLGVAARKKLHCFSGALVLLFGRILNFEGL